MGWWMWSGDRDNMELSSVDGFRVTVLVDWGGDRGDMELPDMGGSLGRCVGGLG